MTHDRDYFRQRAAEARAAAFRREESEDTEVAGQLALAYAALARRKAAPIEVEIGVPAADPIEA
ncbi:MAG TPA: hypothetical protein VNS53_10415 [Sphingomicrobium sp.]|jgi:hypothetical protein|nr:hypothetical protein [Sphingomicrobium sp.]